MSRSAWAKVTVRWSGLGVVGGLALAALVACQPKPQLVTRASPPLVSPAPGVVGGTPATPTVIDCNQPSPKLACCQAMTPECIACQRNARDAWVAWHRACPEQSKKEMPPGRKPRFVACDPDQPNMPCTPVPVLKAPPSAP